MRKKTEFTVVKSDEAWRSELGADAYRVLRQQGTEASFTNVYNNFKGQGLYECGGCGALLFRSEDKYDSGSGWPSFMRPAEEKALGEDIDARFGMRRREIHCANCGGHIGHVFEDGPRPTGLRYCTNSAALKFKPYP